MTSLYVFITLFSSVLLLRVLTPHVICSPVSIDTYLGANIAEVLNCKSEGRIILFIGLDKALASNIPINLDTRDKYLTKDILVDQLVKSVALSDKTSIKILSHYWGGVDLAFRRTGVVCHIWEDLIPDKGETDTAHE